MFSRAKNETVDNAVLSEVFSKLGIETKIDQIEAEFNAEAKAARTATRKKGSAAASSSKEQDLPSQFDEAYGKPAARVRHHKFWTVAVFLLGITLAVQSAFLSRHAIARSFPGTRPMLVSLCKTLGCTMPLPRDASKLEFSFSLNQRDENHYVLYVKVTNNADFSQDWPSLELRLLNSIEQPLSHRIFTPAEWVRPEMLSKNGGIAPKSNVDTHLELEVTGIVSRKCELEIFYPLDKSS